MSGTLGKITPREPRSRTHGLRDRSDDIVSGRSGSASATQTVIGVQLEPAVEQRSVTPP
jgi:hypothetical protein